MPSSPFVKLLDRVQDVVPLQPQIVGRFYGDGNRLGQRAAGAAAPPYYCPERWIGSSTPATNPPGIPPGGLSRCALPSQPTLKEVLADPESGPWLLGEERFAKHGEFRVLLKLLDARHPIPFHVHADDRFVSAHPKVYPNERFGKDEAYYFLDSPKGDCPYTHLGLYPGVTPKDVLAAMRRGTDHVIELSPGALQRFGEGFITRAGLLHRPGTALTLEIQQPSDVYTMFQTDFGGQPLPPAALHPGFACSEEAMAVVNWDENLKPDLLESARLQPRPVTPAIAGGQAHWIYPPDASQKFSGMRLVVESSMTVKAKEPCLLFVWRGQGTLDGQAIAGGGGPPGQADEFFIGARAAARGIEIVTKGAEPLTVFLLFAAAL